MHEYEFRPRDVRGPAFRSMTKREIALIRSLEVWSAGRPQVVLPVNQFLHAGTYSRTVMVPAGMMITGALVKVETLLIAHGEALVYTGDDEPMRLSGYSLVRAAAGRKQAFVALSDLYLTMVFASGAATVEEAEAEFTDEADLLQSRRFLPGEDPKCLE